MKRLAKERTRPLVRLELPRDGGTVIQFPLSLRRRHWSSSLIIELVEWQSRGDEDYRRFQHQLV